VRPPWGEPQEGERQRKDEEGVRPVDDERAGRRPHFDDLGARPSHAPPVGAEGEFGDFCHRLETIRKGVPEGMWVCI
jgi:hypothetical protein